MDRYPLVFRFNVRRHQMLYCPRKGEIDTRLLGLGPKQGVREAMEEWEGREGGGEDGWEEDEDGSEVQFDGEFRDGLEVRVRFRMLECPNF